MKLVESKTRTDVNFTLTLPRIAIAALLDMLLWGSVLVTLVWLLLPILATVGGVLLVGWNPLWWWVGGIVQGLWFFRLSSAFS